MDETWTEDILGPPFRSLTLPLEPDDEGPRVATLVSYEPEDKDENEDERAAQRPPERAVLYLHGFSDYFLQAHVAAELHQRGWAFFALDLHKHGRSLLPGQTPGFVTSLDDYDADLERGLAAVRHRLASRPGGPAHAPTPGTPDRIEVVLMAHSTGGLTAALWAARNPGRVAGLVLNSPWLDTQGSALLRSAAQGILDTVSRRRPKARLRLPELGFYFRSLSDTRDGEWLINPVWRPESGFPIRAGWLAAVLAGHAALARGVSVDAPVLVLCSTASTISPTWSEEMLRTDSVLDVSAMVRRAAELGGDVTIRRVWGALHDVFLSRSEARREAMDALIRWLDAHFPSVEPPTRALALDAEAGSARDIEARDIEAGGATRGAGSTGP
ncbi:alpha/beta hydrolase [Arthrobacter agilis]|uniref:alpha/beta hydrolase n=1 Tax=Arthrobacter agilis TaxID=37921 RepID=UPI0023654116|nr:alpha/beta hydrolase [Arthrobacter agilis]WDF31881.1 alpha/beta hydrolase [Arthrobacter agilis]